MRKLFFFLVFVFTFGIFANQAAALTVTNFNVTAVSACAVKLEWTTDQQPARVAFSDNGGNQYNDLPDAGSTSFLYTDDNARYSLSPGQSKTYKLRVSDGARWVETDGQGGRPGPVTRASLSLPAAPALPDDISNNWVSAGGGQRLDFFWQANAEQLQDRRPGQPRPEGDNFRDFTGFEIKKGNLDPYPLLNLSSFSGSYGVIDTPIDINSSFRFRTYQTDNYCDPAGQNRINYSGDSRTVALPKQPVNFREAERNNNADPVTVKFAWNQLAGDDLTAVSFFRLNQFIRNGDTWDPVANQRFDDNRTAESGFIGFAVRDASYRIELRACKTANGITGCSAPASLDVSPTLPGPVDFHWGLQRLLRNNEANAYLSWKDDNILGNRLGTKIWRRLFGGQWPDAPVRYFENNFPQSFVDNIDQDNVYEYRVDFVYRNGDSELSVSSPVLTANLNGLQPLAGWAWSSNLGWIKLNHFNPNNLNENYGAYLNSNNQLMGYAWSSNAGWLSFNGGDLNGCPGNPDGACAAPRRENNQIIGWARFLAADPQLSSWSGWMHLGNPVEGGPGGIDQGGQGLQGGANLGLPNFLGNIIESFSDLFKK